MNISNKKKKQIQFLSVWDEVLKEYGHEITNARYSGNYFWEYNPPEEWSDEETELFECVTRIEDLLKEKILEIIENGK